MLKPRILGHPVHIILAHFPSALYPMSVACATLFYCTGNKIAGHVSFYTMMAGAGIAWLSIISGLWESLLVPYHKTKIVSTIFWHATLNSIVTIVFTLWAVKAWSFYPEVTKDGTLLIVLKWVSILVLFAGNYLGGKLLLKYHVGVEEGVTPDLIRGKT